MRRMYSEQELTNVIKAVFEQELADGALDENVANAVDAYLVENPVDITALEGQDVELASLDATGLITGGEIVEKMSGYSFDRIGSGLTNWTPIYVSAVKNGNKITFVIFGTYNAESPTAQSLGYFNIPSSVADKLYPYPLGIDTRVLDTKLTNFYSGLTSFKNAVVEFDKHSTLPQIGISLRPIDLVAETTYYFRVEATFLLSDNFVSE